MAATPLKLLERLTVFAPPEGDALLKAFLTTFRSFITPKDLLDLLMARFKSPKPLPNFEDKELAKRFVSHVLLGFHKRYIYTKVHVGDM